jgi:beta-glucosidase
MKKQLLVAALAGVLAASVWVHLSAQAPATKAPAAARAAQKAPTPAAPAQDASKARIDSLVASMTLDEKISMLHGATDPSSYGQAGYLPGVPRLGIPPLRLSDGPAGIRTSQPATALPAPVAVASTFSPDLAKQYGQIIGRDARARHQNVVLAPMVNIVRVPQGGRNFETLGEDPLLAARLVVAEIEGIQGEGSIATVKHYAFNNQENARMSVNEEVDEQTGREIELPGFEAAVRAGVGSVMSAYNRVNGEWSSQNVPLLTDLLRREWGFKGFVMSDWGATHSAADALKAGQEMEMPSGRYYSTLPEAVKKGEVSEAVISEAVRRILTAMDAAGILGAAPRPVPEIPVSSPAARDIAIAGAVLLKNQGNLLPLGKDDLQSLLVVGPTAKQLLTGGGGSAAVPPMHRGSPLEALQQRAGSGARIAYVKGYDVDGDLVPADALKPAVAVNFTGAKAFPAGSSWTWTGTITAPKAGEYTFKLQTGGGRGSLAVGAQETAARQGGPGGRGGEAAGAGAGGRGAAAGGAPARGAAPGAMPAPAAGGGRGAGGAMGSMPGFGASALLPTADGLTNTSVPAHLEAGVATPLTITTNGRGTAPLEVRLAWLAPDAERTRIDEAVAAAKTARTVLVFAYDEGTEGRDRASLSMPGYQDRLIEAVAAANPRTVVVLNNGAPILMPWADKVAAVLQMWYPGQEGADATAAILVGEASPGGRLPVTFPRRAEDAPTAPPERYPGVNGRGVYSEGIFVGYRWYDQQKIEPLFPFGHGLTYTTFGYSGLNVRPATDGYDVTFTVKNTGTREGVDVPQVYIGPPEKAPAPMALKKLVGFERISLAPGQSRQVKVHVDARGLSYWSTKDHRWTVAPGRRTLMVGSSSRTISLKTEVTVRAKTR